MNHNDFFERIKSGALQSVYLMEGPEEYIKGQAIARLCARLLPAGLEAMNLTELENPDADMMIAAAETLPFMADKRVVIVRECDLLTTSKKSDDAKLDAMKRYLERVPDTVCLLFTVKGKADARKSLYLALKKANAIVDFSPMSDQEAANWAIRVMRAGGKSMDVLTAQKLVFTVGHDAALLRQEMDKLMAFAQERTEISEEDIDSICTRSLEATIFQLVDAQVGGKIREACTLLQTLLENGEDRFMVLALLLRQYRILYHARCLSEERVSSAEMAALLGIPPFAVTRTQSQAKRYSKQRLRAAYDYLYDLEFRLKSGKSPQEGSAEAALFTLNAMLLAED